MKSLLNELNFKFRAEKPENILVANQHFGVVGSGDLEVLIEQRALDGSVEIKVVSPVTGFNHVWELILEKIINETAVGNVSIEINDNNATPVVVAMRLRQAITEAKSTSVEQ